MSTRPDQHDDHAIQTYIAGMTASRGDKAKILSHVKGPDVVELGCGNGVVLQLLAETADKLGVQTLVGVDACSRLLGVAGEQDYGAVPVELRRQDLLKSPIARNQWDTVVCCSFIHEIFSVLLREDPTHHRFWEWFGECCLNSLKPGGRLIVRDGIKPPAEEVYISFKNEAVRTDFFRFADDFELSFVAYHYTPSSGAVRLSSTALYEFSTKYFYKENWAIELKECFGWTDMDGLQSRLPKGFQVVREETYCIPYLKEKWSKDLDLRQADGATPYEMPSTMLTVIQRDGD